ncbi:Vacuolar protein sorting-associated protein 51-like protein [Aphelenchoides bicaudatus]|nr:Vacuolar protein sorting-associated protein 51-like protein [Aphelenchoides bicaudatus]
MADPEKVNINSNQFDSESFVNNLILKKGLDELVTVEEEMVQSVRRLDYEMQVHLIYENYNKFLTATNTVKKMQDEFTNMDNKMSDLTDKMARISNLSSVLSEKFSENRETVNKLTESSKTVKSLQFIVTLPQKLRTLVDARNYSEAIRIYNNAKPKLEKIKDFKSVAGIYADSKAIIERLERQLWVKVKSPVLSSEEFIANARLLSKLGVDLQDLEQKLVTQWENQLNGQLSKLESSASRPNESDILDFVDNGVCPFLADLSLVASLYTELFPQAKDNMNKMIVEKMHRVKAMLTSRFEAEVNPRACDLYVRSLDRVYRKINACCRMFPSLDFDAENTAIVLDAAHHQIQLCRANISNTVKTTLTEIATNMQSLKPISGTKGKYENLLLEWLNKLEQSYLVAAKTASANLLMFTANEFNLMNAESIGTLSSFGVDVHEKIVVGGLQDLCALIDDKALWPEVLEDLDLIYSIFLHQLTKKNLKYLMDLAQEQYKISEEVAESLLTRSPELIKLVSEAALKKLEVYVNKKSGPFYKMLEVEDSNWLEISTTPVSVRRQIVNFIAAVQKLDHQLQMLLDDSTKKERTPESIRNSRKYNFKPPTSQLTNQSSLEKMWSDTVEEFGLPVLEFKRHAIIGCVVDKCLRLFLEWIRQQKFSRPGVQQLQIDCFFQKQYLWKHVTDEISITFLIDEFLTTAVNLCSNPQLLEPTIVKQICDKK